MYRNRIKYYRLRNGMSKRELSARSGIKQSDLDAYEDGRKIPSLKIVRILVSLFGIKLADMIGVPRERQKYEHLEFRKKCNLSNARQDYIRLNTEDYFDRFFLLRKILREDMKLEKVLAVKTLKPERDVEFAASNLRRYIGFTEDGPLANVIDVLENKGILIYILPYEEANDCFFGMNGTVNGQPYIVLNSGMTAERLRSTLAHELVHMFFDASISSQETPEKYVDAVSGAFLFPKKDAIKELGELREGVSSDMVMVAREYGISLQLLAKRANVLGIISDRAYKRFNIMMNKRGYRKKETLGISREEPHLFEQLTLRAIEEGKISAWKGAELMQISREEMQNRLEWNI